MSDVPAISVTGVGKFYRMYSKPADLFWELVRRRTMHTEKHVLSDITFDVQRGEVVGIIGANGAGKSTLLSIIAGTLQQSSGEVDINGTLTAILELGTGFNPEQSGRQNVYLGGIAMGMTRREVDSKIDGVIAFAELEDVIDQPFKTYSSGMQARLTFSTAISVEPDVLIVDEALAAGDAAFVQKCLRRVEEIVTSGSTVLLVSHSSTLITRFASRALWLDGGRIVELGDAETVCKHYEIDTYNRVTAYENRPDDQKSLEPSTGDVLDTLTDRPKESAAESADDGDLTATPARGRVLGDQKIRVVGVEIEGREVDVNVFAMSRDMWIHVDIDSDIESTTANLYISLQRKDDHLMVWTATSHRHLSQNYELASSAFTVRPGRSRITLALTNFALNRGSYFLNVGVEPKPYTQPVANYHDYKPQAIHFSMVQTQDNEELTKVFLSPSAWTASGHASIELDAEPVEELEAMRQIDSERQD